MTALEWLFWAAVVWAAWMAFALLDVPSLLERAVNRLRHQPLPHWARHGHAPPPDPPAHGRHARGKTTKGA